jgi:ferredoxin
VLCGWFFLHYDFCHNFVTENSEICNSIFKTMDNTIQVTIIDRAGKSHLLEGPTDMNMNIMELCKAYELPVEGACGGMAMCATCQCYLESDTELPEQSDAELDMLDQAFHVKNNSRLGCQIHLSEDIDGIVLRLAPEA